MSDQGWREDARRELLAAQLADHERLMQAVKEAREAASRVEAIRAEMLERVAAATALGITLATAVEEPDTLEATGSTDGGNTAKEIILEALRTSYPKPLKAAELKEIIEAKLGRTIHYKTPGMSLYRLGEENLVRREGHRWFAVKEDQQSNEEATKEEPIEYDL